jgi:hypothetical protein
MERIFLGRRMPAFAAMFLLCGCGFSAGLPPTQSSAGVAPERAVAGSLLYVANANAASGVDILTLPKGETVGKITHIGDPRGVCADASGHVWITAYGAAKNPFALYEFARGATKPLHTVHGKTLLGECTVDSQGDVAVFTVVSTNGGAVEIWPPSLQGKPRVIDVPMHAVSGAYDPHGNLYLNGFVGLSSAFAELPKGSSQLTSLSIKNGHGFPNGSVAWDGTHVTVGGFDSQELIDRLTISGGMAKVSSVVHLEDLAENPLYAIGKNEIVAQGGSSGEPISLYAYPAGGKPIAVFSGPYLPMEIAISPP